MAHLGLPPEATAHTAPVSRPTKSRSPAKHNHSRKYRVSSQNSQSSTKLALSAYRNSKKFPSHSRPSNPMRNGFPARPLWPPKSDWSDDSASEDQTDSVSSAVARQAAPVPPDDWHGAYETAPTDAGAAADAHAHMHGSVQSSSRRATEQHRSGRARVGAPPAVSVNAREYEEYCTSTGYTSRSRRTVKSGVRTDSGKEHAGSHWAVSALFDTTGRKASGAAEVPETATNSGRITTRGTPDRMRHLFGTAESEIQRIPVAHVHDMSGVGTLNFLYFVPCVVTLF